MRTWNGICWDGMLGQILLSFFRPQNRFAKRMTLTTEGLHFCVSVRLFLLPTISAFRLQYFCFPKFLRFGRSIRSFLLFLRFGKRIPASLHFWVSTVVIRVNFNWSIILRNTTSTPESTATWHQFILPLRLANLVPRILGRRLHELRFQQCVWLWKLPW